MNLKYRLVPRGLPPPTNHLEFDFVVAERPRYIPGSGPPLAPVTIMPPDDRDGYIIDQVVLYSELRYIVGYHEMPHLRVGVRLPNILQWVSARALEKWETDRYDAEVRAEEEQELPLLEAKEERKKKKLAKLAKTSIPAGTKSRKRKRTPDDEVPLQIKEAVTSGLGKKSPGRARGPGSRNQHVEEIITFKSPKQSQHSQQQPSLSTPGRGLANRTVLDTDSDDEDENTELALTYQLLGREIPRSNVQSSRSNSPPNQSKRTTKSRSTSRPADTSREESRSPSVSGPPQKRPAILPARKSRSTSRPADTSREESRSPSVSGPTQKRPAILPPPRKGAVAATSSRDALKVYEDLERRSKKKLKTLADEDLILEDESEVSMPRTTKKPQTLADKYSHTKNKPQPGAFKGAHSRLPPPARGLPQLDAEEEETDEPMEPEKAAEEDTDSEYELRQILKHKVRVTEDGKPDIWYLIDWVGEWDNTWEPAENVGQGAIDEYEAKRMKKTRFRGMAQGDGNGSDSDSLFVSEGEGNAGGNGKDVQRVKPGQVFNEDNDDDDEDEVQWEGFSGGA
jgi:hypothetical protein